MPDEDYTIRPLRSEADYNACIRLQKETWGENFSDVVPLSILKTSQWAGGIASGAFDPNGVLVGLVFGMTGVRDGRLVHWSDLLAVRPEARSAGVGRRLKEHQRDTLIPLGVEAVYWTFDPLEARNANLNLNKLGATVYEYVENMYGDGSSSVLQAGLGTDRFIVEWELSSERVERALAGTLADCSPEYAEAPIVNTAADAPHGPLDSISDFPESERVRIEVPDAIQEAKKAHAAAGRAWREATRRAFLHYLSGGYRVEGIDAGRGRRCFYLVRRVSP